METKRQERVGVPEFDHKKLLRQSASINWALFAGIDAYFREQGQSPALFFHWLGRRLALGWQPLRGDLSKMAINLAFDAVATGAQLCEFEAGEDEATIRFTLPDMARASGMAEPVAAPGQIFNQILDSVDVDLEWEQDGEVITYHLRTRAPE